MVASLVYESVVCSDRNMLAFSVLTTPEFDVHGVRLDGFSEASASLWQLLSRDERDRAEKFRFVRDQQHYVVARATLRRLLAERLHIAPEAVQLIETEYGKPKLAPAHSGAGIEFNVSHSGELALYAFASGRAIGVDVETIREVPDAGELAERFFSPAEAALLGSFPHEQRSLAFLACWTRKEAFIKALGLGLSCPLDAFDVTIDPVGPARITRIDPRIDEIANWKIRAFTPLRHYIAAVAFRR
jgi:4'-phosphopantetheinyl transferase